MATQKDRDKLKQLNIQLRDLLAVTPKNGAYVVDGINYNKRGYDELVKNTRDEIKKVEKLFDPPSTSERVADETTRRENLTVRADNLSQQYDKVAAQLLDIQQSLNSAKTIDEEKNLGAWVSQIQRNLDQISSAIQQLRNGVDVADPSVISVPSLSQVKVQGPRGSAVPEVTTPPVTSRPGMVSTGLTAGQRGEAGILQNFGRSTEPVTPPEDEETTPPDTTPDVVDNTTPEVVSDTAPIATPTGPSYTDPATNVTYQPGQQIGGEDRSLPNGGGVVNGIYIPPGIDYTWLGQQVPSDWEEAAQELYGGYYEMLKQVPELGRLLKEAFEKGWEPGGRSFQYALEQTDWWKTTNASARAWQEKLIRDPATATTELNTRVALLRGVAQDMGISLSPETLEQLATDSIILNFQLTSQYEDVIGSEARKSAGGVSQLRYGYVGNSIRESARKYGISLSDTTFNEWVDKIAVGAESQQTFESYAQQIARNLYPALNNGFDRGLSFADMTDPYAQVASRILEIPGAQVDFTDPKWAAAFTMKDTKGQQMQMSFGEWADYLRTDPRFGWEYTDDAKNRAYTVVNRLGELFGAA